MKTSKLFLALALSIFTVACKNVEEKKEEVAVDSVATEVVDTTVVSVVDSASATAAVAATEAK